jgi:hypothetical protein
MSESVEERSKEEEGMGTLQAVVTGNGLNNKNYKTLNLFLLNLFVLE